MDIIECHVCNLYITPVFYIVVEYFCSIKNWWTEKVIIKQAKRHFVQHFDVFYHTCIYVLFLDTCVYCMARKYCLASQKNTTLVRVCIHITKKYVCVFYKYSISCDTVLFSFQNRSHSFILFGYYYILYHKHFY